MKRLNLSKRIIAIGLSLFIVAGGITGFKIYRVMADNEGPTKDNINNTSPSASFGLSKIKKADVDIMYDSTNGASDYMVSEVKANITNQLINAGVDANVMLQYVGSAVSNFSYTGSVQTFTVPISGTYKLETWGAQGGAIKGITGGVGGYSEGTVFLKSGDTLNVYVGGKAPDYTSSSTYSLMPGGYNGGGNGDGGHIVGTGGGGATDIRTSSTLASRIIVAGGGSGATSWDSDDGVTTYIGGAGGGLQSTTGIHKVVSNQTYNTKVATQSSGYSLGQGGSSSSDQAGGGGGYYGGYAGSEELNDASGGSGYIGGVKDGQTIAGNQSFTAPDGSQETGQSGNGYARISFSSSPELDTISWRQNSTHFIVNVSNTEASISNLASAQNLACMENQQMYFIGAMSSDYKDKVNSLIHQLDNRGIYIEQNTIDSDLKNSESYIISILNQKQDNSNIFLVGDEVNYNETYKDSNGDRKNDELWSYIQDNKHLNYDDDFVKCSETGDLPLDNDLGIASFATGQWMHNKVTVFDKPGSATRC